MNDLKSSKDTFSLSWHIGKAWREGVFLLEALAQGPQSSPFPLTKPTSQGREESHEAHAETKDEEILEHTLLTHLTWGAALSTENAVSIHIFRINIVRRRLQRGGSY